MTYFDDCFVICSAYGDGVCASIDSDVVVNVSQSQIGLPCIRWATPVLAGSTFDAQTKHFINNNAYTIHTNRLLELYIHTDNLSQYLRIIAKQLQLIIINNQLINAGYVF